MHFGCCFVDTRNSNAVKDLDDVATINKGMQLFHRPDDAADSNLENKDYDHPVLQDQVVLEKVLNASPFNLAWVVARLDQKVLQSCHSAALEDSALYRLGHMRNGSFREGQSQMITTPNNTQPTDIAPKASGTSSAMASKGSYNKDNAPVDFSLNNLAAEHSVEEADEVGRTPHPKSPKGNDNDLDYPVDSSYNSPPADESVHEANEEGGSRSSKRAKLTNATVSRGQSTRTPASPSISSRSGYPTDRRHPSDIPQFYDGHPPDPGKYDGNGKVIHKTKYSPKEVYHIIAAIKEVPDWFWLEYDEFGIMSLHGDYIRIKNYFPYALRNRDCVSIKDKVRNLLNNDGGPLWDVLRSREGGPERKPSPADADNEDDDH